MSDRDALLRAICENPDDDAPRLIYADWLDEHGDPLQAEFIRLQMQFSPVIDSDHPTKPRQIELWREMRKWRYARADFAKYGASEFVRGFCPRWSGSPVEFLRAALQFWRFGPITKCQLQLDKRADAKLTDATQIVQCEWLGRLREISLSGRFLFDEFVVELLASEHTGRWTSLWLQGEHLTDALCEPLLSSALRSTKCHLIILAGLTNRGARMLADAFSERVVISEEWLK